MIDYVEEYDFDLGMVKGYRSRYDWVSPSCSNRTPEEYPYSFDAYYVWRDKDIKGADPIYSDRMWQWDREKAQEAFGKVDIRSGGRYLNREQANTIIKAYYGENMRCVGYARDCNHSTGYELGIFFIKKDE